VRTFARRRLIKRSDDEDAVDTVAELLALRLEQGHGELAGVELAAQVGDEFEEIAPRDAGLISSRIEKSFHIVKISLAICGGILLNRPHPLAP